MPNSSETLYSWLKVIENVCVRGPVLQMNDDPDHDHQVILCLDQFNVLGKIASCLSDTVNTALIQSQALMTLRSMLSREDFFSAHYHNIITTNFFSEIYERCEELSLSNNTSREIFHLSCDITEKYLKQKDKTLINADDSDDENYYIAGQQKSPFSV